MGAVAHTGMGSKANKNTRKKTQQPGVEQMRFFSLEKKKRVKWDLTEAHEVIYCVEKLNLGELRDT